MLGVTTMSGFRGSPSGGIPGSLKYVVSSRSEKISPMPATLLVVGAMERSRLTASAVVQLLFSHIRETSSSVGPMPVGLDGASERGKHLALSRIVAGEVVTGSPGELEIPR